MSFGEKSGSEFAMSTFEAINVDVGHSGHPNENHSGPTKGLYNLRSGPRFQRPPYYPTFDGYGLSRTG